MSVLEDRYPILESKGNFFVFESRGPKGIFPLVGIFQPVRDSRRRRGRKTHRFNFAFGKYQETYPYIDDKIELHNGDMDKIFHTVANEIRDFLKADRLHVVLISGSTPPRLRKYHQLISKHFGLVLAEFVVKCIRTDGAFADFVPNSPVNYESLLIENKID